MRADYNNGTVGREDEETFFILLEEFDFLKYGLASRKDCTLKSGWVGEWGMYICYSLQFKKMHVHGFIIGH